ncbi:DUF1648 domain-containing protein [Paenibacillus sp. 1P07SE]|uniref:DUF1648 domain-containing protein n=1 Tax=Paenibacillus sp. 1P07SE TaxID=3132209 RepID=UPI0039A608F3
MENWTVWLLLATILLPVSFMLIAVPYLTRRTESFGISITEEVYRHPDVRQMRRHYAIILITINLLMAAAIVFFFQLGDAEEMTTGLAVYLVGMFAAGFAVYLRYHYLMKRMKQERNWGSPTIQTAVIHTSFRQQKLAASNYWFIPHLLLTLATLAVVLLFYDRFPDTLVMQYGFDGEVTRSAAKSYSALLWPVGIQMMMIALFMLINFSIVISKQQIDAADPEGSMKRNIIFRRSWSVFLVITSFLIILMLSWMSISNLLRIGPNTTLVVVVLMVASIIGGSIWLSVRLGQGGSRIRQPAGGPGGVGSGPSDNDKHWKLGVIYFNPSDPALFLEKRFGVGWTINMGRPLAWLIAAIPIVIVILSLWYA